MSCEICSLDSSVETVMWECVGCTRTFHAACVGVPVKRGSLRRNDKKIDTQSYVIPCCSSCQVLVTMNFDFKLLIDQQAKLTEIINNNSEVTHRSAQQNNVDIVHKAIDHLDTLLTDIKKELAANKSIGSTGNVIAIKNHMTSLNDVAMQASNKSISTSLQAMTSSISSDLRCLSDEVNKLSSLTMDLTTSEPMRNNPMLELDILDELKSISANIMTAHSTAPLTLSPDLCPSLDSEINNKNKNNSDATDSGWRLLGTRKVWRPDWTDYDARVSRRLNQQKLADKAIKRRKQNTARHNLGCNNSNNNIRNNNIRNKNNNNNNYNNKFNNQHQHQCRNDNYDVFFYNNSRNSDNSGINRNNIVPNRARLLPSDRELLAVAKDRFSRPPTNYQPTMQFHRGEILNPYPASEYPCIVSTPNRMISAVACEECSSSCRHSCFRQN